MNFADNNMGMPYGYRTYLESRHGRKESSPYGRNYSVYEQSVAVSNPKPFYMTYPIPVLYENQEEQERDMEYLKSLYPDTAREIQRYIEEECDKLEYEGSLMFDETPDRLMLRRICMEIYDKVKENEEMEEQMPEEEAEEEELFTMQYRPPRRNRRRRNNGVQDMIEVLLFNEMYRRRCRHRDCRRRIF